MKHLYKIRMFSIPFWNQPHNPCGHSPGAIGCRFLYTFVISPLAFAWPLEYPCAKKESKKMKDRKQPRRQRSLIPVVVLVLICLAGGNAWSQVETARGDQKNQKSDA